MSNATLSLSAASGEYQQQSGSLLQPYSASTWKLTMEMNEDDSMQVAIDARG